MIFSFFLVASFHSALSRIEYIFWTMKFTVKMSVAVVFFSMFAQSVFIFSRVRFFYLLFSTHHLDYVPIKFAYFCTLFFHFFNIVTIAWYRTQSGSISTIHMLMHLTILNLNKIKKLKIPKLNYTTKRCANRISIKRFACNVINSISY